jgi:hypothetical protein
MLATSVTETNRVSGGDGDVSNLVDDEDKCDTSTTPSYNDCDAEAAGSNGEQLEGNDENNNASNAHTRSNLSTSFDAEKSSLSNVTGEKGWTLYECVLMCLFVLFVCVYSVYVCILYMYLSICVCMCVLV